MKKLQSLLKGHKHVVFMDFEGTQFSHEMIAIGAVLTTLDKNGNIKKYKKPFKMYVTAKNKIGRVVTNLTGITEATLQKEGVSFAKAMFEFKKYCGFSFKKASFITFGNHDMKILGQSLVYNIDAPREICSQIQKNYIDYLQFIQEFIKDESNNPYSLVNYVKHFNLKEAGDAHDPEVDAVNLAHLYQAFLDNKGIVLEDYLNTLSRTSHLPLPIQSAAKKLAKGEDVTAEEFAANARKYLE